MNASSNQDLNERVLSEIPFLDIKRFRANVIVDGVEAYNEDNWKRIRIGSHRYRVVTITVRCKMPNVDQATGEQHPLEPDRTLRSYRNIDKGSPLNACMGEHLVPLVPLVRKLWWRSLTKSLNKGMQLVPED